MKKTLLVLAVALISLTSYGQLNENAKQIKELSESVYLNVKSIAVDRFGDDHEMVVYTINSQSDAVFEYLAILNDKNYDEELMESMFSKWSVEIGEEYYFDYEMMVYNYNKQIASKGQY
tara:strand:- start:1458 stop:1814 length:357 start_codon:yes stop_codon:yes gene_type:complete